MKWFQPENRYGNIFISLVLFLVGAVLFGALAMVQKVPGYMDAEYYYMGGINLAEGKGFWEMVIWNYLDNPGGLPHPSHTYWMPLPSILAAAGLAVMPKGGFFAAQTANILLAACIPALSYWIAKSLYQDRKPALFAAGLAFFPGYYLVYLTTTDTVTPYIVLGGFFLLTLIKLSKRSSDRIVLLYLVLGLLAGLMHLTRSDGIFWLIGAALLPWWLALGRKNDRTETARWQNFVNAFVLPAGLVLTGYLLVMGPWFVRNLQLFGKPLAPGGFLTLWLQNYNQTFVYPPDSLNFSSWLQGDLGGHLQVRLEAVYTNLISLVAVQGEILLFPFFIIGIISVRGQRAVQILLLIWLFTFVLMSVIFPFAGMRGGFLHASAGFQTLVWVLVPSGFQSFMQWGKKRRGWKPERSAAVFRAVLFVMVGFLSFFLFFSKTGGAQENQWQKGWYDYVRLERAIAADFPDKTQVIVVNNPPGYFLASGGRSAVVIPDGDEETLMAVAGKFNAQIVAVDRNIVDGLRHLYDQPSTNNWLKYLYTVGDTRVYQVQLDHPQ